LPVAFSAAPSNRRLAPALRLRRSSRSRKRKTLPAIRQPLSQKAAARDDEPFFVVWTDAKGYSSAAGINVSQGGPNKKATDHEERSFQVNLTLTYAGKENENDRETKCSFHIEVLDQKSQINP
jgi:hypothetical protein